MATNHSVAISTHATLSTTTADSVTFSHRGRELAVTNLDDTEPLYFKFGVLDDEVQTIALSAGDESDTFDLTWGGNESSTAVTIPAGGHTSVTASQIQTTLESITGLDDTKVLAAGSAGTYTVTFTGSLAQTDVGAITITSATGNAAGTVTETTKGVMTAAADDTWVVPASSTVVVAWRGSTIGVIGSGNTYSAAFF
jgi:hypothetical protein